MRKNSSAARCATERYFSDVRLISAVVAATTTDLSAMSVAMRLVFSSPSISSRSSVMSPCAAASLARMPSSSALICTLNALLCLISAVFCDDRSGRSRPTVSASSCSSRPASVTVKFTSAVSACTSGAKCGLDSFVCRNSRKPGCQSTSLSPSLSTSRLPRLTSEREMTGCSTASTRSGRFSMMTGVPRSIASSSRRSASFWSMRSTTSPASLKRSRSQPMPCSCGSMSSGQRSEAQQMAPFSTETLSSGSPSEFQPAMVASSVSGPSGLGLLDSGMRTPPPPPPPTPLPPDLRNGTHALCTSSSRKRLVKGPM